MVTVEQRRFHTYRLLDRQCEDLSRCQWERASVVLCMCSYEVSHDNRDRFYFPRLPFI